MLEISPMDQFLAQSEGGELIEVLVLLIIMALSALGSVLKGRKSGGKKKPPPVRKPKRPVEMAPGPVPVGTEERDARTPKPYDFTRPNELETSPPVKEMPAGPRPTTGGGDSTAEPREVSREPWVGGDLLNRKIQEPSALLSYNLGDLGLDDLRKAIILKEVLGTPRAIEAYGQA